jgi:hypothetical protein
VSEATPGAAGGARHGALRALLAAAAVLAVFFSPALLSSDQFLFRDAGRMHWPVKRYVAEELRRGRLPEWNPYAGLGTPFVGGAVDAVQHPFNLLLVALPFELGFKLWVLASYLLAACGGYAWGRQLGRGWHASLASGLAFALGGYLVSSSDNLTYLTTLAALPWVFAAAHAWLRRGGAARLALLGAASFLCASGGDPQAWGLAVALLPAYGAVSAARGERLRGLARGLGGAMAASIGAAPVVVPVLAWVGHSARALPVDADAFSRWSLVPVRLLEIAVPHILRDSPGALYSPVYVAFSGGTRAGIPWVLSIYCGASVVVLAAVAAARSWRARLLVLGALGTLWMALGEGGGFGAILPHLPVLRAFRHWEKMAIWCSLFLSMAAGRGVDAVIGDARERSRLPWLVGALAAGALLAAGAAALGSDPLAALLAPRPAAIGAARALVANGVDGLLHAGVICLLLAAAALAARRRPAARSAPLLVVAVVVGDLAAANVRAYTLGDPAPLRRDRALAERLRAEPGLARVHSPSEFIHVSATSRAFETVLRWSSATLAPSSNVAERVGNFQAYVALSPARLERFRRSLPESDQGPNLGLFAVGWATLPASPGAAQAARLPPPHEVAAVEPALPALLLRLPHRERAYLAQAVSPADEGQGLAFALTPLAQLGDRSVVEGPVPPDLRPPKGGVRFVRDEPERVELAVSSDREALLVLNDTFAPGWRASIDGAPAAEVPANYLARGVWVPAGAHRVAFEYRTPGLAAGWSLAALGGLALLVSSRLSRRRTAPRDAPEL